MIRLARILNNTNNWEKPSGKQRVSGFTQDYGFGYEEWLNSTYLKANDKRYGFIEALHKSIPKGEYSKVFLYTYLNNSYKIVGVINDLEYLTNIEQITIENKLNQENKEHFHNEVKAAGWCVPKNLEHAKFKVNFSVENNTDLKIGYNEVVEITPAQHPSLHVYLIRGKIYRLSVLYKLNKCIPNEMELIEKLLLEIDIK